MGPSPSRPKGEYERIVAGAAPAEPPPEMVAPRRWSVRMVFVFLGGALIGGGAVSLAKGPRADGGAHAMTALKADTSPAAEACCSWTNCATCGVPGDILLTAYCGGSQSQCESYCGGDWCPTGPVEGAQAHRGAEDLLDDKDLEDTTEPCCSWTACDECGVPADRSLTRYCSASSLQCMGYCAGLWCPFGQNDARTFHDDDHDDDIADDDDDDDFDDDIADDDHHKA